MTLSYCCRTFNWIKICTWEWTSEPTGVFRGWSSVQEFVARVTKNIVYFTVNNLNILKEKKGQRETNYFAYIWMLLKKRYFFCLPVCDNKIVFILVSNVFLMHFLFNCNSNPWRPHWFALRPIRMQNVSNRMNFNEHSEGVHLCGRGLDDYLWKAGDVSWHVVELAEPMVRLGFIFLESDWLAASRSSQDALKSRDESVKGINRK